VANRFAVHLLECSGVPDAGAQYVPCFTGANVVSGGGNLNIVGGSRLPAEPWPRCQADLARALLAHGSSVTPPAAVRRPWERSGP
jgi:hypothetical protein